MFIGNTVQIVNDNNVLISPATSLESLYFELLSRENSSVVVRKKSITKHMAVQYYYDGEVNDFKVSNKNASMLNVKFGYSFKEVALGQRVMENAELTYNDILANNENSSIILFSAGALERMYTGDELRQLDLGKSYSLTDILESYETVATLNTLCGQVISYVKECKNDFTKEYLDPSIEYINACRRSTSTYTNNVYLYSIGCYNQINGLRQLLMDCVAANKVVNNAPTASNCSAGYFYKIEYTPWTGNASLSKIANSDSSLYIYCTGFKTFSLDALLVDAAGNIGKDTVMFYYNLENLDKNKCMYYKDTLGNESDYDFVRCKLNGHFTFVDKNDSNMYNTSMFKNNKFSYKENPKFTVIEHEAQFKFSPAKTSNMSGLEYFEDSSAITVYVNTTGIDLVINVKLPTNCKAYYKDDEYEEYSTSTNFYSYYIAPVEQNNNAIKFVNNLASSVTTIEKDGLNIKNTYKTTYHAGNLTETNNYITVPAGYKLCFLFGLSEDLKYLPFADSNEDKILIGLTNLSRIYVGDASTLIYDGATLNTLCNNAGVNIAGHNNTVTRNTSIRLYGDNNYVMSSSDAIMIGSTNKFINLIYSNIVGSFNTISQSHTVHANLSNSIVNNSYKVFSSVACDSVNILNSSNINLTGLADCQTVLNAVSYSVRTKNSSYIKHNKILNSSGISIEDSKFIKCYNRVTTTTYTDTYNVYSNGNGNLAGTTISAYKEYHNYNVDSRLNISGETIYANSTNASTFTYSFKTISGSSTATFDIVDNTFDIIEKDHVVYDVSNLRIKFNCANINRTSAQIKNSILVYKQISIPSGTSTSTMYSLHWQKVEGEQLANIAQLTSNVINVQISNALLTIFNDKIPHTKSINLYETSLEYVIPYVFIGIAPFNVTTDNASICPYSYVKFRVNKLEATPQKEYQCTLTNNSWFAVQSLFDSQTTVTIPNGSTHTFKWEQGSTDTTSHTIHNSITYNDDIYAYDDISVVGNLDGQTFELGKLIYVTTVTNNSGSKADIYDKSDLSTVLVTIDNNNSSTLVRLITAKTALYAKFTLYTDERFDEWIPTEANPNHTITLPTYYVKFENTLDFSINIRDENKDVEILDAGGSHTYRNITYGTDATFNIYANFGGYIYRYNGGDGAYTTNHISIIELDSDNMIIVQSSTSGGSTSGSSGGSGSGSYELVSNFDFNWEDVANGESGTGTTTSAWQEGSSVKGTWTDKYGNEHTVTQGETLRFAGTDK